MKAYTAETQSVVNPEKAVELLLEGNQRFLDKKSADRDLLEQVQDTAKGQYPIATIISCIDSRIPTEIVFDQGIGDIFNVRIAGNFINDDILGSLEFACKLAGSKTIMVMGHTSCGAVKGACDNAELGNLTQMLAKIMPAVNNTTTKEGEARNSGNIDFVNRVSAENVRIAIEEIKAKSPVLVEMLENEEISVVGAMYNVASGKVTLL
jgi:carbonic anhydrase